MGDQGTASTLVLVAAILQIIFSLFNVVSGAFSFLMILPIMADPIFWGLLFPIMISSLVLNLAFGVIGLIFAVFWLNWREYPSGHKTGLIVTGILALIFSGFIPGLLALIGGVIGPSPSELQVYEPVKKPTAPLKKYCPSCGAQISDPNDLYCWNCGGAL